MAKKDKDIFDKIMDWKIFGWLRPFYVKNKEMLLYLFFGVLTTAVSFVTAGISKVLLEQAGIGKGGVSTTSTVILRRKDIHSSRRNVHDVARLLTSQLQLLGNKDSGKRCCADT